MKKHIATCYHVLQFVHEYPMCRTSDVQKFFKKFYKDIFRKLEYMAQRGFIEIIEIPVKSRKYRYYRTTDSGKRFIDKNNGNVCTIVTGLVRGFLKSFPECVVPDRLDVNWDEESPHTHPTEENRAGILGMDQSEIQKRGKAKRRGNLR